MDVIFHCEPARPVSRAACGVAGGLLAAALLGAAAPASAASAIAQRPLTASQQSEPNMVLLMDDSGSMEQTGLPPPSSFSTWEFHRPHSATGNWITIPNNGGGTVKARTWDMTWENAIANPLWYNPGVVYKPWNDNGKPAAENFPPADVGRYVNGQFVGGAPWDPRSVQNGPTRLRPNPWTTGDLFRRSGERDGPTCLREEQGSGQYCASWLVPPSGGSEAVSNPGVCAQWVPSTYTYCAEYEKLPALIPARYYRLEAPYAQRHDALRYRLVEIDRDAPTRSYPTPNDSRTGAPIARADCANPTACTFAEEAQNFSNWFGYYRTRLFATIGVTSHVLSGLDGGMRLGYGRINYYEGSGPQWPTFPLTDAGSPLPPLDGQPSPGHVVRGVRSFERGTPERQQVFDWLFTLYAKGTTPNREALDAVGRYYSRSDPSGPWSSRPGTGPGGGTADVSCRRSYTLLATDGAWTNYPAPPTRIAERYGGDGTPRQSDAIAGLLINGGGLQAGRNYQYLPLAEPAIASGAAPDQTLTDVAFHYWSRDLRPDLVNNNTPVRWPGVSSERYPQDFFDPSTWQNMSTMVIAYGLESQVTPQQLRDAMRDAQPVAWPSLAIDDPEAPAKVTDSMRAAVTSRGDFFSAQDPAELQAAMSTLLRRVQAKEGSSTGIAVSSPVIRGNAEAVYRAGYATEQWTGSLSALRALDLLDGRSTALWTASIPDAASRRIFTATALRSGVAFQWSDLTPAQQTALGSATTLDYLRGDRAGEQPAGPLRARQSLLGTIVHSTPLYSKATDFGLHVGPTAGGAQYANYLATKASRLATVLVGANDGMLHAFDAADGRERFAYVPRAALSEMKALADAGYDHRYLVDGPLAEGDVYFGGQWRTVVAGTSGAGPKSLFALDITDPAAFGAGKVLFDLTAAEEPDLGHVMGRPLIASTRAGKWVVITGNGYESTNDRAVLLIHDLETGNLLRKIDTGVGSGTARNGLGPVSAVYDGRRDVIAAYAGDKLGNVWKFDLSSDTPSEWNIARVGAAPAGPLFTATDAGGQPQSITTEIRITQHPLGGFYLAFGTGRFFEVNDPGDTTTQALYFLRDRGDLRTIAGNTLAVATLADVGDFRRITGARDIDWSTRNGWTVRLATGNGGGGERIIASPVLSAGIVVFTSFKPTSDDPCTVGGGSYTYSFDLATGLSREIYDGQGPDTVGRKLQEGVPGGLTSLYVAPPVAGPVVSSVDAAALNAMIGQPRYSVGGGSIVSQRSGSRCAVGGSSLGNATLAVPTACSGTLPLRVWRDLR